MITELAEIQGLAVFLRTDGHSEGCIDITDLLTLENSMFHSLLDVQDLTPERKDCLSDTVSALFCSTTRRVSLDEEELALFRIS
jgi:hypothetical protein